MRSRSIWLSVLMLFTCWRSSPSLAASFGLDCDDARYVSRPTGEYHEFHAPLRAIGAGPVAVEVTFEPHLPADWFAQWCLHSRGEYFYETRTIVLEPGLLDHLDLGVFPSPTVPATGWIDITVRAVGDPYEVARCTYTLFSGVPVQAVDLEFAPTDIVRYVDEPYTYFELHNPLRNGLAVTDTVMVTIQSTVPESWDMHFCHSGICYNPYGEFPVAPGSPDSLTIMAWVGEFAGMGATDMVVQSKRNPSLAKYAHFRAFLEMPAGAELAAPRDGAVRVIPNPSNREAAFFLQGPPGAPAELSIFSVEGKLLRSYSDLRVPAAGAAVRWDGLDGAGRPVPSGVYLYQVRSGGSIGRGVFVRAR